MAEQRTTVQTFGTEAEAHLAAGHLARKGIKATVTCGSRYKAMGGGGYGLRVLPNDVDEARRILVTTDGEIDMDEYVDADDRRYRRCPACNSVNIEATPLARRDRATATFTAGLALLFLKRDRHCRKCGHIWRC